jgi:hypothetical protein
MERKSKTATSQSHAPTEGELAARLGPAALSLWHQLITTLVEEFAIDEQEWHTYSAKAGWSLRLKQKHRAIVYLSPCEGFFRASFALGDKALLAARRSGLPVHVLRLLEEARRYAEGTAVRVDVRCADNIEAVKKLVTAKQKL